MIFHGGATVAGQHCTICRFSVSSVSSVFNSGSQSLTQRGEHASGVEAPFFQNSAGDSTLDCAADRESTALQAERNFAHRAAITNASRTGELYLTHVQRMAA
jgi:hypothetical protein